MPVWIVRESSSGRQFFVPTKTNNEEEVYKQFAKDQLGMDVSGDFDTANVDIDILDQVPTRAKKTREVGTKDQP
jgi:hypothetical protein